MRRIFALLALTAVLAIALTAPAAHAKGAAAGKKHNILFQWNEGDSLGQLVMTLHLKNLLADQGDKVNVEVITYGMATFAVTTDRPNTKQADAIKALTAQGVKFVVCHHAMDILGVKESELMPEVTPVKGAMNEIVEKYKAGWQILRP